MITTPLNIITSHLQVHQYHLVIDINQNPYLIDEAAPKPHRFWQAKNYTTTTSYTAPASIARSPVENSNLATFLDTPEYTPNLIPTFPSEIPLEVIILVPNYKPRESPSDETSISTPDISTEEPPYHPYYEPSVSPSGYPSPLPPYHPSEEPISLTHPLPQ